MGSGSDSRGNFAWVWDPVAGMIDAGVMPGGSRSSVVLADINNQGTAVGFDTTLASQSHAVVWDRTHGMQDLNTMLDASGAGLTLYGAYGINEAGQIVTDAPVGSNYHAFLLTPNPAPVPEPLGLASLPVALVALAGAMTRRR